MTKKWIKINDLPSGQYYLNKKIKFKNSLSRSNLCDYSNAYIFVKKKKYMLQALMMLTEKIKY